MTPWLSLVVCTRDRLEKLRGLVASLAVAEPEPGVEVVFVDNGSEDGTAGFLEALRDAPLPFAVSLRREPRGGLSFARNRGLEAARADLIAFTDDDCRVATDYFTTLRRLDGRRAYDFFGGRVLAGHPDGEICLQLSRRPAVLAPGKVLAPGSVHGANMAFRRDVFRRAGRFDVLLGAGSRLRSGEDLHFLSRALDEGFRGRYSPELVVHHDSGRRPGSRAAREARRGYDYGRGAWYADRIGSGRPRYLLYWMSTWHPWSLGRLRRELRGAALYLSLRSR